MNLVQQLVKQGILEQREAGSLEYEIKNSEQTAEQILLDKGVVSEDFLFNLKSEQLDVPLKEVEPGEVPLEVLEMIPEDSVKYYHMIPLGKEEQVLQIGMVYPENLKAKEALKFLARQGDFEYQVFLIKLSTFDQLLKKYRSLRREVGKALEELEVELRPERVEEWPKTAAEFRRMAEQAPVSKIVAVILRHAVDGDASDIHIEPQKDKARVRFRVDGILHSSIFLPLKVLSAIVARVKILSDLKIDETRIPQDGRFSTKINGKEIDFRVATFPTNLGEKVAIRVLDPEKGLMSFDQLGLEGRNLEVTSEAIQAPYGMILAVGPTGCGKTTTLYSIVSKLKQEEVNIVTLEDPIEYFIEGINQSQVKPDIGYDFNSGLRQIVRQDPDIIMVGEIRDQETADLAAHAALTGHLLLSTLHTATAPRVIPRLIDLKVPTYLLPSTLSLAIGQRLVRKLCPHCKEKVKAKGKIKEIIAKEMENMPEAAQRTPPSDQDFRVFRAPGCKQCNFKGLIGRTAIFEVLKMTDQLAEIILGEASESELVEEARRQGMVTMRQDGILKALKGVTTMEEVLRVTEE